MDDAVAPGQGYRDSLCYFSIPVSEFLPVMSVRKDFASGVQSEYRIYSPPRDITHSRSVLCGMRWAGLKFTRKVVDIFVVLASKQQEAERRMCEGSTREAWPSQPCEFRKVLNSWEAPIISAARWARW